MEHKKNPASDGKSRDSSVSLVICAFNEADTIGAVIRSARLYVDEIIVVDGHSTDGTDRIAEKLADRSIYDSGKGKGEAIRCGVTEAKGGIIVCMDADGSHNTADIPKLVRPIREGIAPFVIASRSRGGSDELTGTLEKTIRLIGSAIITLVGNLRFGGTVTDSQNGFRAIRKDVLLSLRLSENTFTIEQEMVLKALKHGYRIEDQLLRD